MNGQHGKSASSLSLAKLVWIDHNNIVDSLGAGAILDVNTGRLTKITPSLLLRAWKTAEKHPFLHTLAKCLNLLGRITMSGHTLRSIKSYWS